jgi:hypothetical protein
MNATTTMTCVWIGSQQFHPGDTEITGWECNGFIELPPLEVNVENFEVSVAPPEGFIDAYTAGEVLGITFLIGIFMMLVFAFAFFVARGFRIRN